MLTKETFFVFGKTIDPSRQYTSTPMAIAAYSDKFKKNERVDTMYFKGAGTHYGLNLPEGNYTLLVYADKNKDMKFQPSEVVALKKIALQQQAIPDKIKKHIDITLSNNVKVSISESFAVPSGFNTRQSLFYPTGSIRQLDDPIFNENIATLGMYDPASFTALAPTMFYALEEDIPYKIPVVFVHGIGDGPRAFNSIIEQLDKNRYKPWFFYYPSGGDLKQLATLFYNIFISGKVVTLEDTPLIIVAHSMGGLITREALNQYKGSAKENKVSLMVTIASPLNGHSAAASGEKYGLIVLPAWRDLNPESRFTARLFRKALPEFVNYQLFYAYQNSSTFKSGENNDGVVPLSSQLRAEAQNESQNQFGFNSNHTDILSNDLMIQRLIKQISQVKSQYPESHLEVLFKGGLNVPLSDNYSPLTQYLIHTVGHYLVALINGSVTTSHPAQLQFIQASLGKIPATTKLEKEFKIFVREYPELLKIENQARPANSPLKNH